MIGALEIALTDRNPFQCCGQEASVDRLPGLLTAEGHTRYIELVEERSTPNPIHCGNRLCGIFVPPSQYRGPDQVECRRCGTSTCRHCRSTAHPGQQCEFDIATQQARALASANGWKSCPRCSNMVEKRAGCNHMTCLCYTQFCYRCGRIWSTECSGNC
jgi:IBR domain, a half RING-finger domain